MVYRASRGILVPIWEKIGESPRKVPFSPIGPEDTPFEINIWSLKGERAGRTRHKSLPSKNHLTVVHIPPRKESFIFDSHFFSFIGLEHV